MKIVCIADNHGNLKAKIPECDILIHAGDIFGPSDIFLQQAFLGNFNYWLDKQPAKNKLLVAGNHDWYFEKCYDLRQKPLINCDYLLDEMIEIEGLKIYGTPWQPIFLDWAFNLPEDELCKKWELIPEGLDILITHCPPYGILDECSEYRGPGMVHVGSKSLAKRIEEVKPKLCVFGHIHESYGQIEKNGIRYVNASVLDGDYKMKNEPIVIEL